MKTHVSKYADDGVRVMIRVINIKEVNPKHVNDQGVRRSCYDKFEGTKRKEEDQ